MLVPISLSKSGPPRPDSLSPRAMFILPNFGTCWFDQILVNVNFSDSKYSDAWTFVFWHVECIAIKNFFIMYSVNGELFTQRDSQHDNGPNWGNMTLDQVSISSMSPFGPGSADLGACTWAEKRIFSFLLIHPASYSFQVPAILCPCWIQKQAVLCPIHLDSEKFHTLSEPHWHHL